MRARFSVSRTALREAYSSLAAKGLIAARPKVGTRVRPKSDWNMLDPEVLAWHIQTLPNENLAEDLYVFAGWSSRRPRRWPPPARHLPR